MADISSLYPDLAALRSSGISDRMRAEMALMDALNYQSAPVRRGPAGGMGRAANMIRARGARGDYFDALTSALNAEAGYNDLAAQLEALQAAQQAEAEQQRKIELERVKADQGIRRDAAKQTPPDLIRSLLAAGIDPQSEQGRAIIQQNLGGRNTTYNVTPPQGYTFADPQNPAAGFAVIPGSPQARELEQAQAAEAEGAARKQYSADNVVSTIDRLMESIGPTTAGWGGLASEIPGSSAKTVKNDLNTVMANLAFDRLQQMRDASKTGGALGQVSNIELDLLKSTVAGLEQTQDPEELRKRLQIVRDSYQRFTDALSGKMPEGYDSQGNPVEPQAEADGEIYHNPQTGEKIRWNGKEWVRVQ